MVKLSLNQIALGLQLAINDLEDSFAPDPFRFSDYDFQTDNFLKNICEEIKSGTYRPKPLLTLDAPKGQLAIRPATRIEVRDLTVLFALLMCFGRQLDSKLTPPVTAYRVRTGRKQTFSIQRESAYILPKKIRKALRLEEEWYNAWPIFIEKLKLSFGKGYIHGGLTDITAFFECIDLDLLRSLLLSQTWKKYHKHVTLLVEFYNSWARRDPLHKLQTRGIPQGTNTSGLISNFYLIHVDNILNKLSDKYDLAWYRYCDDIKILGKDPLSVRKALLSISDELRRLNLIQQGSKTKVLPMEQVEKYFFDRRNDELNDLTNRIDKKKLTYDKSFIPDLKRFYRINLAKKRELDKQDWTLLSRVYGLARISKQPFLLKRALRDITEEPSRTKTILYYLEMFKNRKIAYNTARNYLLDNWETIFSTQKAQIISWLRAFPQASNDRKIVDLLKRCISKKGENWYVRQQSLVTLSLLGKYNSLLARFFVTRFDSETEGEIRRAIIALSYVLGQKQNGFLEHVKQSLDYKATRMCNFILSLSNDDNLAKRHARKFSQYNEYFWRDNFWRWYPLVKNKTAHSMLVKYLRKPRKAQMNKMLITHIKNTIGEI